MDVSQLEEAYDKGIIEINGLEYEICKMSHGQRVKVFAYFTSIANDAMVGNFAFMGEEDFKDAEKNIFNVTKLDGDAMRIVGIRHFEECPENYIEFIVLAMGVISYPFLRGKITSSQSQETEATQTTSKKPMSRMK